jgi:phage shock protein A
MNPRDNVQKVAVRVIASELDRRSGSLEQAIRDLRVQMTQVATDSAGRDTAIAQLQTAVNSLSAAQERMSSRIDSLTGRVTAREHADVALDDAVRSLRFDHEATATSIAEIHDLLAHLGSTERISQAELP